jgi:ABC-type polysaccharide/polyol phosphate transport system ATPase subunit
VPHIILENANFHYNVYEVVGRSLKVSLFRQMVGSSVERNQDKVTVHALRDVSLNFKPGDRVGLVGRNGAGKSTLLRVIAGLAHPQNGRVDIQGRVVPLIEKGLGVNPELSGERNLDLPLHLLGATPEELRIAKLEIPEWTGLGPFFSMPVRTYSEGMKTRLMFAISTAVSADILVLDEWLGAGDIDFAEQAEIRLRDYLKRAAIVVLASHSLDLIQQVCNVAVWMDGGRAMMVGRPDEVIRAYTESAHRALYGGGSPFEPG